MALTVEDGTNVSNADALTTVAFVDTYHADNPNWAGTLGDKEAAIKAGTRRLDLAYAFKGARTFGRLQSLVWPRKDVTDCEGNEVGENEIPIEVQRAVAELALLELLSPSYNSAAKVASAAETAAVKVKREKLGELEEETEYFQPGLKQGSDITTDPTLSINIVDALLKCFATATGGDEYALFGKTIRS